MPVINLLASSQGFKGNVANIALAKEIASSENHDAVKVLADNLGNQDKNIQGDCIKTLYETGYRKPECEKSSQVNRLEKVLKQIEKV